MDSHLQQKNTIGRVAELADASDLKSEVPKGTWGFESPLGYLCFVQ